MQTGLPSASPSAALGATAHQGFGSPAALRLALNAPADAFSGRHFVVPGIPVRLDASCAGGAGIRAQDPFDYAQAGVSFLPGKVEWRQQSQDRISSAIDD